MEPLTALEAIWRGLDLPEDALAMARCTGEGPGLPSSFAVGAAAQAAIAASGLAAALLWQHRTGESQRVTVDLRHACAAFRSERYVLVNGRPADERSDGIAGLYPTGGGGWVRLHTNFPHHRAGVLRLLGCAGTREAVGTALQAWDSLAFEDAAAEAGLTVTALRDFAAWDAHPQGQAVPTRPLVSLTRIGDAPPRPLPDAPTPLGGIRALDLTRVIAGPVSTRTLAAHGAEVLTITGPHLPSYGIEDLGRGKRSAQLDLRDPAGREILSRLIRAADVFVQGYRPGAIASHGYAPDHLAALRPGIVSASLSAYGTAGPWSNRRGFDSLVQTASGFNVAEARAAAQDMPRPLPAQALDHATGYLLATGIMAALHRRAAQGGSWHVEVSLARTGAWLRGLGRVADGLRGPDQAPADVADLLETSASGFGELQAIRHAALLSATPARWAHPSVRLGTDQAAWP